MSLKRCPFCGGRAKFGTDGADGEFVECAKCRASSVLMRPEKCDAKELLAERWNQRQPSDTSDSDEIATLKAELFAASIREDGLKIIDKAARVLMNGSVWLELNPIEDGHALVCIGCGAWDGAGHQDSCPIGRLVDALASKPVDFTPGPFDSSDYQGV